MNKFHITRRGFFKRLSFVSAATGLPIWYLERELAAADAETVKSANDKPGIALIGCGGQGRGDAANA
ncbi:MAG TPA: gfo/Idh/MocA family oxidoreductase, partial [Verrucomicrobiota bacterium]|nr:gfo/Idh/MocA family oxidoreductase [Verrucomicrobiota bacterium]